MAEVEAAVEAEVLVLEAEVLVLEEEEEVVALD